MEHIWMLAYDISDNKRRRSVAKRLEDYGSRVQYSVFECRLSPACQHSLMHDLASRIKLCDTIRWYPLCACCEARVQWQGIGGPVETHEYYLI